MHKHLNIDTHINQKLFHFSKRISIKNIHDQTKDLYKIEIIKKVHFPIKRTPAKNALFSKSEYDGKVDYNQFIISISLNS